MYLADNELRALIAEFKFQTADAALSFDAEAQVQPCSIDLRLDRTFWRPLRSKTIDLGRSRLREISPRSHWRRIVAHGQQSIELAPGEMVLGRTYESFCLPKGVAAQIEGRSSFGRLGLLVNCTASLVNPGWRGRIPLQLVNLGINSIRITPLIPICQLVVMHLSSQPSRLYGAKGLYSKYMDDDGGPSCWWRDQRIEALQIALGANDVSEQIQDEILKTIGDVDVEIIGRLEEFVTSTPRDELTNADEVLDNFSAKETRRNWRKNVLRDVAIGSGPLLLACSVGSLFSQPFGSTSYGWIHYILWITTLFLVPVSVFAVRFEIGDFLTTARLSNMRRNNKKASKTDA